MNIQPENSEAAQDAAPPSASAQDGVPVNKILGEIKKPRCGDIVLRESVG